MSNATINQKPILQRTIAPLGAGRSIAGCGNQGAGTRVYYMSSANCAILEDALRPRRSKIYRAAAAKKIGGQRGASTCGMSAIGSSKTDGGAGEALSIFHRGYIVSAPFGAKGSSLTWGCS